MTEHLNGDCSLFNCHLSFETGSFRARPVEVLAGSHQFFPLDFGPAQYPVAVFGNFVATRWFITGSCWAGADCKELVLGEPAQRTRNMVNHLASRPSVD